MADFYDQIHKAADPRSTKEEIVEYFQEKFPEDWRERLVNQLRPFSSVVFKRNLSKRFDPSHVENAPKREKEREEYRKFSKTIPGKAPENGYHIFGVIYIKFSDGDCEEREVDEIIAGDEADELTKAASAAVAERTFASIWMGGAPHNEPSANVSACDPPDLNVEAVEG